LHPLFAQTRCVSAASVYTQVLHPTPKGAIDGSVKIDNIDVSFVAGNVRGNNELHVSNGEWRVAVKSMPYPPYNPWVFRKADARLAQYVKDGAGKTRVDVRIGPIGGLRLKPVAPHGLLGQTYDGDGIAVDGAMDDYHGEYVVTTAMGEVFVVNPSPERPPQFYRQTPPSIGMYMGLAC